jgi:phosphoribosylformimino-5-aminoimidazole carboxamide ribotide isomerase
MRIIPAIDIIEGKAVRLSQGDYSKKTIYNTDPLEVAKSFEGVGLKYLHLVDLDGAKAGEIINWKVLEKIAANTSLEVDFGGGVKTNEAARIAFECGARQITGGSIAVKDPATFEGWLTAYGSDKIILGADCKDEKIATLGWTETSDLWAVEFIQNYREKGIEYVICTDISKDGMLEGPSFELYKRILGEVEGIKLIASGGVSSMKDLEQLAELGMEGAIVGKAIYENKVKLGDLALLNSNS